VRAFVYLVTGRGFNVSSGGRKKVKPTQRDRNFKSCPRNQRYLQICPCKSLDRKLLDITLEEIFAFLLGVQLPGRQLTCHGTFIRQR
jgi:hypothetical protein